MEKDFKNVIEYYDNHTVNKLQDFIHTSPRIELAWDTLKSYAPGSVKNILEIGCGMGSICHRMKNHFTHANVWGLDISPKSLETARKLFGREGLEFIEGPLKKGSLKRKFDLIVLMDVYEHISINDRYDLHLAIDELLEEKGRIILSFPTPHYLAWLRKNNPIGIQPVDEDVDVSAMLKLANDTKTEILLYKKIAVWHEGDYAHAVLERNSNFEKAFDEVLPISLPGRLKRGMKKVFWRFRMIKNKQFAMRKLK